MKNERFTWPAYFLSQIPCGFSVMLCALVVDNALRQFGVDIHPWKEAIYSGAAGMFFATLFMPLVWRLGLTTLPQYMLGALGVFIPATLLSLVVIYQFQSIIIDVAELNFNNQDDNKAWAITLFIRITRSLALFPPYVFVYWLVYHKYLGKSHF